MVPSQWGWWRKRRQKCLGVSSWKRQKAFLSVSIKQFPALYIKIAKSKKKKGTKKGDSDALIEALAAL